MMHIGARPDVAWSGTPRKIGVFDPETQPDEWHPMATMAQQGDVFSLLRRILGYEAQRGPDGLPVIAPATLSALKRVPQPFPYQGSKRALAHAILCFLPEDTNRLIEPFAGSGAISIATRYTGAAKSAVINDINKPLMALWQRILNDPSDLADRYEEMWIASETDPKAYFLARREEFNETNNPDVLLYLLNRIVKAAVRYGKNGNFNQSADNRRRGAIPKTVRERIELTSSVMKGSVVCSESYESLLTGAGIDDVVYMDPPYQGVTDVADHRYMAGLRRHDYERVLSEANDNGVSYIVSYDAVTSDNKYGEPLSPDLGLVHLHIAAGPSAQATLNGSPTETLESLYLSPALVDRLSDVSGRYLFG